MSENEPAERASLIERLSATARSEAGHTPNHHQDVEMALAFLRELDVRTLRELEQNFAQAYSSPGDQSAPHLTAVLSRMYFSVHSTRPFRVSPTLQDTKADLLDTLVFRDLRHAHGTIMYARSLRAVKKALGIGAHESLAAAGIAKYGSANVFLVLHVAHAFANAQLTRTSAHITPSMGYSGLDAYADALDACHFMTHGFAAYLMRSRPHPDVLASTAIRRRLEGFGISPTDIDQEQLRRELLKLEDRLPVLSASYSSWEAEDAPATATPPTETIRDDEIRMSFAISERPGSPRTVDQAEAQRLYRKGWPFDVHKQKPQFMAVWGAAAALLAVLSAWARGLQPSPDGVIVAAFIGATAALAVARVLDSRAGAFYSLAERLSRHTVLQGRRDQQFLVGLRRLRPEIFVKARSGNLTRLITIAADHNGIVVSGEGPRPRVLVAIHWLRIVSVTTSSTPSPASRRSTHRIEFTVHHNGEDVVLTLPVERAKISWTQRSFVENSPLTALLTSFTSLPTYWAMVDPDLGPGNVREDASERRRLIGNVHQVPGTAYEKEALAWERSIVG